MAGGAQTAYGLSAASSDAGSTGRAAAGMAGMAKAGAGFAMNKAKEAAGRSSETLSSSYRAGQSAAWKATGGENDVGGGMSGTAEATPGGTSQSASPPPWAERMQRRNAFHHGVSTAAHSVRSGDHGGGSMSVSLNQDDHR